MEKGCQCPEQSVKFGPPFPAIADTLQSRNSRGMRLLCLFEVKGERKGLWMNPPSPPTQERDNIVRAGASVQTLRNPSLAALSRKSRCGQGCCGEWLAPPWSALEDGETETTVTAWRSPRTGSGFWLVHLLVQSPALHCKDTGNEFQLSWATGAPQKESPLGLGLHPPVNWSRPSTRRGRGLPWMSVRHIFLMRFRSFGKRRRRAPSEGSGAP